jgi:hypothetical protein
VDAWRPTTVVPRPGADERGGSPIHDSDLVQGPRVHVTIWALHIPA